MTVIEPGGGEVVGDSPERRVEILCDEDALAATWTRYGPRREGADLHIHRRHSDLFYVIEGELTVRLGALDALVAVPAGTLVRVPPFVVHGFRNGGDSELRYLNLHAPGLGFADYLRAMRDGRPSDFDQEPPPGDGEREITDAVIGGEADTEEIAVSELAAGDARGRVGEGSVEAFYVLDGDLAVAVDGGEERAAAGAWVQIPPGATYAVTVASRALHVRAPGQRSS
jgi:mannose-6-phosphate isomerase-like protein (cupin superfamily)